MAAALSPLPIQSPPSDPILATLANVHTCYGLRGNRDRLQLALLTAYFDESGVHHGDHLCVVAGFVGNDAQWQAFAADWIPAIRPRLNLLMTELPWTRRPHRVTPLLEKLGPIPHKYNLKPVSVSLPWSDYNSVVKGKVDPTFTNPYIACAMAAISVTLREIAGTDEVFFLFDRQEGLRRETMEMLRDVVFKYLGMDSRVKGIDFIPRRSTVCLDPADYLAFTVRERGIDEKSIKATSGDSIIGTKGGYGGVVSPEQLAWMLEEWQRDGLSADILAEMVKNPFFRGPK